MATVDDAVLQAMRYVRTMKGIKGAPDRPPDQLGDYPFSVGYAGGGLWKPGPALSKTGLHTIVIEVHVARGGDLPKEVATTMPFVDSIPNMLMYQLQNDNQWRGTIDTFQQISYTFGPLSWNETQTFGIRFRVEGVKIQNTISAPT